MKTGILIIGLLLSLNTVAQNQSCEEKLISCQESKIESLETSLQLTNEIRELEREIIQNQANVEQEVTQRVEREIKEEAKQIKSALLSKYSNGHFTFSSSSITQARNQLGFKCIETTRSPNFDIIKCDTVNSNHICYGTCVR